MKDGRALKSIPVLPTAKPVDMSRKPILRFTSRKDGPYWVSRLTPDKTRRVTLAELEGLVQWQFPKDDDFSYQADGEELDAFLKKNHLKAAESAIVPAQKNVAEMPMVSRSINQPEIKRGRGRPRTGKSSNPAYQPTTVILDKEAREAAEQKWAQQTGRRDLSELITTLLRGYAQGGKSTPSI